MTDVTHLPQPGVVLDLDTVQRDESDVKPPFIIKLAGRQIVFKDPATIDWKELALIHGPQDLIRVSLEDDDRRFILDQSLPSWKFGELMNAYEAHYEIADKMRKARQQASLEGLA